MTFTVAGRSNASPRKPGRVRSDAARGDVEQTVDIGARSTPIGDPSEEKALQSAADVALLNHQEFVTVISHDLRNDLSVASVNAELLKHHVEGNLPREHDLPCVLTIQRAIEHMDRLVSDLLDLARIDGGRLEVKPEIRDTAEVVRESVETFHVLALSKSVSLRAILPRDRLPARIDPARIRQVMSNLLVNAIKFTPANGEVQVEARRDDHLVVVEVRDSGTGIPENQLAVIFERYAQVKRFGGAGLGLGLYIARWIVDAHGGKIWARSRIGEGTTFGFCIPRALDGRPPARSSSSAS